MGMPSYTSRSKGYSLAHSARELRKASNDLKRGHRDGARARLRSALEDLPTELEGLASRLRPLLLEAARVASRLEGSVRLASLLKDYLRSNRKDEEVWLALFTLTKGSDNWEEAARVAKSGLRYLPRSQELSLRSGEALARLGKKEARKVLWKVASGEGPWSRACEIIKDQLGASAELDVVKAGQLIKSGDYPNALLAFDAALREDPRCEEALVGKAKVQLSMGDPKRALETLLGAVQIASTRGDLWLLKAVAEDAMGDDQEAARSLEVGLRYEPYNLEMLTRFGSYLVEVGRNDEAADTLRRAVQVAPEDSRLQEKLSASLRALALWEEYRGVCRKLSELNHGDWKHRFMEARSWIEEGRPEAAEGILLGMMADNPSDLDALGAVAGTALEAKLWGLALGASERLLKLTPRDAKSWLQKAKALESLQREKESLEAVTKSAKLQPTSEALRMRMDLLKRHGSTIALYECCRRLSKLEPQAEDVLMEISQAAARMGRVKHALLLCDRSLKAVPSSVRLRLLKARLLTQGERHGEALREYSKILEGDKGNFEARKGYAMSLFQLRSFQEAEVAFEGALKVQEDFECLFRRGMSLQELGRQEEAIASLRRAVGVKGDSDAWAALGQLLLKGGRLQEALEAFEEVLEVRPHDSDASLGKAQCLIRLGNLEQALAAFEASLSTHQDDPRLLHAKVDCLVRMERFPAAREITANLTSRHPRDVDGWLMRADLASRLGQHTEALECIRRAARLRPRDPLPRLEEARVLLRIEDFAGALQAVQEVVPGVGDDPLAATTRGEALLGMGKVHEALDAFNVALDMEPQAEPGLRGKILALTRLGRHEEALRASEILIENASSGPWGHYWKAKVLEAAGEWEEALRCVNEALHHGGAKPDFLAEKGLILFHLGRGEESLRVLEDSISGDPKPPALATAKLRVLVGLGRYEEALRQFEALTPQVRGLEALLLKAEALDGMKRWEEALDILERASRRHPASKDLWLKASEIHAKMGDKKASLRTFDVVVQLDPRDPELWRLRGKRCEALVDWREAFRSYSSSSDLDPTDAVSMCGLGRACMRLGEYDRAKEAYQRALAADPTLKEAVDGSRLVEVRRREEAVKAYAWRVLEFEALNERPATKEEAFRYCGVPAEMLDDAMGYVNEPPPMEILSLTEEEMKRLEGLSRDVLSVASFGSNGLPRVYEILRDFPELDLGDARQVLEYVRGVFELPEVEGGPANERLMRMALEVPRDEWNAPYLAQYLRLGAYDAKRLEGALRIFGPKTDQTDLPPISKSTASSAAKTCRKHGVQGIYQHYCGQYLCSACIVGGRCPVCRHPVSEVGRGQRP